MLSVKIMLIASDCGKKLCEVSRNTSFDFGGLKTSGIIYHNSSLVASHMTIFQLFHNFLFKIKLLPCSFINLTPCLCNNHH